MVVEAGHGDAGGVGELPHADRGGAPLREEAQRGVDHAVTGCRVASGPCRHRRGTYLTLVQVQPLFSNPVSVLVPVSWCRPVRLHLDSDQEFFRETTARFLGEFAPVAELRRLRDDPPGFEPDVLAPRRRAGLDLAARRRGRTAAARSAAGLVDLTLVAHEFGRHAAPGRCSPTNVVAAALSRHRATPRRCSRACSPVTSIATWCLRRAGRRTTGSAQRRLSRSASTATRSCSTGSSAPVEAADGRQPSARHRPHRTAASPRCSCPSTPRA